MAAYLDGSSLGRNLAWKALAKGAVDAQRLPDKPLETGQLAIIICAVVSSEEDMV